MKKIVFSLMIILCTICTYAKKQVVYVEYFTHASRVSDDNTESIRGSLISAFMSYPHIQVVDVASQASLIVEKNRRNDVDAFDDETARIGKMRKLGANYVIQGYISNMEILKKVEYKKNGKSKITYDAVISYTIKVIDCENGTLLSTDVFTHDSKNNSSVGECINKMSKKLPLDVKEIVTKNFKLSSIILDTDFESKNGRVLKCYINLGEKDGVVQGTVFSVKKAVKKADRITWIEVGEIVVNSIVAEDLALCKVKRGSDDIYIALEEVIAIKKTDPKTAHDLIVVSKSFR